MTWTNFSFQTNQVLTAAQLNNLQSNFGAMANGDTGAPIFGVRAMNVASTTGVASITPSNSGSSVILSSGLLAIMPSSVTLGHSYLQAYIGGEWRGFSLSPDEDVTIGTAFLFCGSGQVRRYSESNSTTYFFRYW